VNDAQAMMASPAPRRFPPPWSVAACLRQPRDGRLSTDSAIQAGDAWVGVFVMKKLATCLGLLIAIPAMVLFKLGPEVHFDAYGFHHRDGSGLHFEMSSTASGTNFQIGQPPLR
jgi:hypothetical protein